jgi:crotonobetainyl-CoA:carnitine CoA-transferase CaiB-like acyl-CoA transferase
VPPPLRFPPRLGEHNAAVYGEALAYGAARLAELRERGVI